MIVGHCLHGIADDEEEDVDDVDENDDVENGDEDE